MKILKNTNVLKNIRYKKNQIQNLLEIKYTIYNGSQFEKQQFQTLFIEYFNKTQSFQNSYKCVTRY